MFDVVMTLGVEVYLCEFDSSSKNQITLLKTYNLKLRLLICSCLRVAIMSTLDRCVIRLWFAVISKALMLS